MKKILLLLLLLVPLYSAIYDYNYAEDENGTMTNYTIYDYYTEKDLPLIFDLSTVYKCISGSVVIYGNPPKNNSYMTTGKKCKGWKIRVPGSARPFKKPTATQKKQTVDITKVPKKGDCIKWGKRFHYSARETCLKYQK